MYLPLQGGELARHLMTFIFCIFLSKGKVYEKGEEELCDTHKNGHTYNLLQS